MAILDVRNRGRRMKAPRPVVLFFNGLKAVFSAARYLMVGLLVAECCFAQQQPGVVSQPGATVTTTSSGGTTAEASQQQPSVVSVPGATLVTTPAPNSTTTTSQQPPNGVEIEVGIASRIGGPSISNYQSTNGVLSLSNLGRATPQLLTGLGFSCDTSITKSVISTPGATLEPTITPSPTADQNGYCRKPWAKHLGAFVSVQFGSGSNQTISAYSVGASLAVYKYLRLLAGFSLTPSNEISPGFANAAAQYVTKNPLLFPGVNPANLSAQNYGAFDGIQTTTTAPAAGAAPTSTIYYPWSATETRYRGGLLIGVALPINIFNLFSGNAKTTQATPSH